MYKGTYNVGYEVGYFAKEEVNTLNDFSSLCMSISWSIYTK